MVHYGIKSMKVKNIDYKTMTNQTRIFFKKSFDNDRKKFREGLWPLNINFGYGCTTVIKHTGMTTIKSKSKRG